MKNKIVILKRGRRIFTLKNGPPKKPSKKGDVDIMLESRLGKNPVYFENVVAGDYYRHYVYPEFRINAVSWHGYYEIIDKKRLYTPIIHFKDGHTKIDRLWHWGSVNDEEPFAFPICSLFVPKDLNTNNLGTSKLNRGWYNKNINLETDIRLDFFVLPENISADQLLESPIMLIYKFADIEAFNTGNLEPLIDADLEIARNINGNDILIRTVAKRNKMFSKLEGSFSLLIHDPNDTYKRLLDRPVIQVNEINGSLEKPKLFKDIHEDAIHNPLRGKAGN